MTQRLTWALLADGGRDRALEPIISWAIRSCDTSMELAFAGFDKRRGSLDDAVTEALKRYEPNLLFVHRDAEGEPLERRRAEIPESDLRVVRVIPVRMTETWLLIDETAIRRAAGSPNGTVPLGIPKPNRLERVADPKKLLELAMVTAAGHSSGRRYDRLMRDRRSFAERVAHLIKDFSLLHRLSAFQTFHDDLKEALRVLAASRDSG